MKEQDYAQNPADNLETLIVNFKTIDDTCVELSENLSARELERDRRTVQIEPDIEGVNARNLFPIKIILC